MPPETSISRQKRYTATKAQNLLTEHGDFLRLVLDEAMAEYTTDIKEETVDAIALKYARNQGARDALRLFMQKLNSKANE